jgi:hypothetical protein
MDITTDPTHSERRRLLLQQIHLHYRQIIEHVGKTPGELIQIPDVTLPPYRGRFKYLSLDKLYMIANRGLAYRLLNGLSAKHMEILLATLNGIQKQGVE